MSSLISKKFVAKGVAAATAPIKGAVAAPTKKKSGVKVDPHSLLEGEVFSDDDGAWRYYFSL
jgi:hypothetical protein